MIEVAVLGNLSLDRVDGGAPRPGGCPAFAAQALELLQHEGWIVTRCAPVDRHLFEPWLTEVSVPVTILDAGVTSAFSLDYVGEERAMTVDRVGAIWAPADVASIAGYAWAHVAPLMRSDFPAATLQALAAEGCLVSYDGQGLVRQPRVGPMQTDRFFEREVLPALRTLKLAKDEATILAGGRFHEGLASDLGVPELLLTVGSRGAVVYEESRVTHVPAAWPVLGVQTTGAGDLFMIGYTCARSDGAEPVEAARAGSELVAGVLQRRKDGE